MPKDSSKKHLNRQIFLEKSAQPFAFYTEIQLATEKTMKKPLIALMPLWDKKLNSYWMLPGYVDFIIKSGGVPVMLSFSDDEESVKEIAERFDGFIFTGGDDIAPQLYGQQPIQQCGEPCVQLDSL